MSVRSTNTGDPFNITAEVTGHGHKQIHLSPGINRCGHIEDGVALRFPMEGCWVIPFADLERWYLAAKDARK